MMRLETKRTLGLTVRFVMTKTRCRVLCGFETLPPAMERIAPSVSMGHHPVEDFNQRVERRNPAVELQNHRLNAATRRLNISTRALLNQTGCLIHQPAR